MQAAEGRTIGRLDPLSRVHTQCPYRSFALPLCTPLSAQAGLLTLHTRGEPDTSSKPHFATC